MPSRALGQCSRRERDRTRRPAGLRLVAGCVVVLLLAASCATAPAPRYEPPKDVTINAADRKACETYAAAEARHVPAKGDAMRETREALEAVFSGGAWFPPALVFLIPAALIFAPISAGRQETRQARAAAYDAALLACLQPLILAQTQGPDDPAVARSLAALAILQHRVGRTAEAEALFGRALAVYERNAPETDPAGQVAALEAYAAFLRELGRQSQAADLGTRAHAIREARGPKASLAPRSHDFGPVALGTTSPEVPFTLTNDGTRALEIGWVDPAPGEFSRGRDTCTGVTVPSRGTCTVVLTWSPYIVGVRTGVLRVLVEANGLSETVQAALTGVGVAAPAETAPTP